MTLCVDCLYIFLVQNQGLLTGMSTVRSLKNALGGLRVRGSLHLLRRCYSGPVGGRLRSGARRCVSRAVDLLCHWALGDDLARRDCVPRASRAAGRSGI